jgi:hypothetical protein
MDHIRRSFFIQSVDDLGIHAMAGLAHDQTLSITDHLRKGRACMVNDVLRFGWGHPMIGYMSDIPVVPAV